MSLYLTFLPGNNAAGIASVDEALVQPVKNCVVQVGQIFEFIKLIIFLITWGGRVPAGQTVESLLVHLG
jgi:hypothetical protein